MGGYRTLADWLVVRAEIESTLPDGVYSDGERLWRAKLRATSTFEENVAARALFIDLHHDEF